MSLKKLGRYDIIRVLGKGAMGLVYEARDPNLDRRVAIKTIRVENLSREASREYEARFRTEARSAARLQHPNIVSVYDSERHDDVAYLVIEFVQGEDLKQHLDSGKLFTFEQSVRMVGDLLSALDYAHRQNIVHRDVKPANLLIEADGRVKLTDFGVARIQDAGEATHSVGSMVGTLKYMSPEQVQGQSVDSRSDLFAAAVVLYQLLTGKRAFDGDGEFAIIQQIIGATPAPPSTVNPLLPPALDAVMARALAKQPEQRYQTALEFAQALREASGLAADLTTVPPAVPAPVRSGAAAVRPVDFAEGSETTIRQEIELLYWKDVRESKEVEDLNVFLDKFPSGIYADLARRRLKALANPSAYTSTQGNTVPLGVVPRRSTETTQLQAREEATLAATRVMPARAAASADDQDLTRMDGALAPGPSQDAGHAVAPAEPPASEASAEASAGPVPEPVAESAVEPPAASLDAAPARAGSAEAPAPQDAAGAAVRRSPQLLLALAAVLMLIVFGVLYWPTPEPVAPAEVAAPPIMPSAPAASSAPVASTAPSAASSAIAAAEPVASAPKAAASAARIKPVPAKAAASKAGPTDSPEVQTPAPVSAPVPVAVPAPAPAPRTVASQEGASTARPVTAPAASSGPAQACEGRVLLGYQICLTEQCEKPAFANHPVCVERRAAEKMRQEAMQKNDRR